MNLKYLNNLQFNKIGKCTAATQRRCVEKSGWVNSLCDRMSSSTAGAWCTPIDLSRPDLRACKRETAWLIARFVLNLNDDEVNFE